MSGMKRLITVAAVSVCVAITAGHLAAASAQSGRRAARELAGDWSWVSDYPGGQAEGTMHIVRQDTVYSGKGTQLGGANGTIDLTLRSARVHGDSVWVTVGNDEGATSVAGTFTTDSTVAGVWSSGPEQSGAFRMRRAHP